MKNTLKQEYCKEFGLSSFNKYNKTQYSEWLEKKYLKDVNFLGTNNVQELGKLAHEINSKKFKRPIVEHKYTKGTWLIKKEIGYDPDVINDLGDEIVSTLFSKVNDIQKDANAKLISQAPKMHQLCEAMFDMLKDTNSLYLPILEQVLNEINPKK